MIPQAIDAHAPQDHRGPWKDDRGNMQPGYMEGGNLKEFPKIMYPVQGGFTRTVNDPEEQAKAQKQGFSDMFDGLIETDGRYVPAKKEPAAAPEPPKVESPTAAPQAAAASVPLPKKG